MYVTYIYVYSFFIIIMTFLTIIAC